MQANYDEESLGYPDTLRNGCTFSGGLVPSVLWLCLYGGCRERGLF
jgi:hypothetical protein